MSDQEIFNRIQAVIAEELASEKQKITLNANLIKDLGVDYLDLLAVLQALEDVFAIKIPKNDVEQFVTVQQVVNYMGQKVVI
ncbi:acyl carrier protein [Nostoc sp. C117]|uniref:acyl carrier protein n=1 Tax=Nostoc sp. C117 TaxID=3349875 RepID=UPI00370D11FA